MAIKRENIYLTIAIIAAIPACIQTFQWSTQLLSKDILEAEITSGNYNELKNHFKSNLSLDSIIYSDSIIKYSKDKYKTEEFLRDMRNLIDKYIDEKFTPLYSNVDAYCEIKLINNSKKEITNIILTIPYPRYSLLKMEGQADKFESYSGNIGKILIEKMQAKESSYIYVWSTVYALSSNYENIRITYSDGIADVELLYPTPKFWNLLSNHKSLITFYICLIIFAILSYYLLNKYLSKSPPSNNTPVKSN